MSSRQSLTARDFLRFIAQESGRVWTELTRPLTVGAEGTRRVTRTKHPVIWRSFGGRARHASFDTKPGNPSRGNVGLRMTTHCTNGKVSSSRDSPFPSVAPWTTGSRRIAAVDCSRTDTGRSGGWIHHTANRWKFQNIAKLWLCGHTGPLPGRRDSSQLRFGGGSDTWNRNRL